MAITKVVMKPPNGLVRRLRVNSVIEFILAEVVRFKYQNLFLSISCICCENMS